MLKRYFHSLAGAAFVGTCDVSVYLKFAGTGPIAGTTPLWVFYSTDGGSTWTKIGLTGYSSGHTEVLQGTITVNKGVNIRFRCVDGSENVTSGKVRACWSAGCTGSYLAGDDIENYSTNTATLHATVENNGSGDFVYW